MPIRTEDDYRAAQAHLTERLVIMRSRTFTDDEQFEFDALVQDIDAYQARNSSAGSGHSTSVPSSLSTKPGGAAASEPAGGLQAGITKSVASMERTLRQQGITPAAKAPATATTGTSSMQRTLRQMGLVPQAGR